MRHTNAALASRNIPTRTRFLFCEVLVWKNRKLDVPGDCRTLFSFLIGYIFCPHFHAVLLSKQTTLPLLDSFPVETLNPKLGNTS
jgi:hypothetical protein